MGDTPLFIYLGEVVGRDDDPSCRHQALTIEGDLGEFTADHLRDVLIGAHGAGVSLVALEILRLLIDEGGARAPYNADEPVAMSTSITRHLALLTNECRIEQQLHPEHGQAVIRESTEAARAKPAAYDARRTESSIRLPPAAATMSTDRRDGRSSKPISVYRRECLIERRLRGS